MSRSFWIGWLKIVSIAYVLFGVAMIAGTLKPTEQVVIVMLDMVMPPFGDAPAELGPETRLLSAISGGLLAGWAALVYQISARGLIVDPEPTRRMLVASVLVWFAVDSIGSYLAGAPFNVIGNLAMLATLLIPLIGLGRQEPRSAAPGRR
jgi:hypothetical protein